MERVLRCRLYWVCPRMTAAHPRQQTKHGPIHKAHALQQLLHTPVRKSTAVAAEAAGDLALMLNSSDSSTQNTPAQDTLRQGRAGV